MATTMSSSTGAEASHPTPAAPPSRSEIERKLSFRSAAGPPRNGTDSPKKVKKHSMTIPPNAFSGNESDTSSITSSTYPNIISPTHPASPLLTPGPGSVGTLSAIAEREGRERRGTAETVDELDEVELEDVEEEEDGEGDESEEVEKEGGDLQRGMEGERVLKSGYLMKKQERRKAWKRKWFVLRTNKLAYYKDDREYSLKRVLDLKSVQTVAPVTIKKHSFSFGIVTAKRTFLAKASSQDEMDDWVRAINSARRRLSEREEEERIKRTGVAPVAVPTRERPETIDTTHSGTYTSVFSSAAGSFTASPIATGGYFAPHPPSGAPGLAASPLVPPAPSSPMDTTNILTSQMAHMSKPGSSSTAAPPRLPRSFSGVSGRSVSAARREASASSIGSSDQYHQTLGSLGLHQVVSSDDDDEPYFSDPAMQASSVSSYPIGGPSAPVDPNKVILSAYLMKQSQGRGRKVWRKRWFYLTSQGLTYTKSHMDSRPIRFVPLSAVLDALEFEGSGEDVSDSDFDAPSEASAPSRSARQFSVRGGRAERSVDRAGMADEHLFRVVTAKRTFVLCAPTEEDEIKWLAAFRALLNRQRDQNWDGPLSPSVDNTARLGSSLHSVSTGLGGSTLGGGVSGVVPVIMQQPPTPASVPPNISSEGPPTPSVGTAPGPPILERPVEAHSNGGASGAGAGQPAAQGGRGRSATYIAKGAVADVVRRFHPEQNKELPPAPARDARDQTRDQSG